MYPDKFTRDRRLTWVRARSQARFRNEAWNLTFEDFCAFWPTETIWNQRGRQPDNLVLFRLDTKHPWQADNCRVITRQEHLRAKVARKMGYALDHYNKEEI
jgi:ribosomal protein L40E